MLMTREMDYALRVLRALYQEGQQSAAAVARRENMLKRLHGAGLVSSQRGSNGGYALSRPCEELYLSDLILALGAPLLINRCQNPDYRCENRPEGGCGLCRELSRIQEVLDGEFRKTPLSAIFQET